MIFIVLFSVEQILSELFVTTKGEGFTNITPKLNQWIKEVEINQGIIIISTKHTSCSLIINENADPNVLRDLSSYMKALVPEEEFTSIDGKGKSHRYLHSQEGVDDMPAHIRTTLTSTSLSLSVNDSKLLLGTWQAVYLWEHRYSENLRKLNIHILGELKESRTNDKNDSLSSISSRTNAEKINNLVAKKQQNRKGAAEDREDGAVED